MTVETLSWSGSALRLLDQTRLPGETVYVEITDEKQAWDAIRRLVVRGAPAIGVAGAFGAYLGIARGADSTVAGLIARLEGVCDYLAGSRPTAVNLFWALDRLRAVARSAAVPNARADDVKRRILDECLAMLEEDKRSCHAIGENGLKVLDELARDGERSHGSRPIHLLTHCNAGSLATVAYGTALAPIYVGVERGRAFHVYADETRPLLQGSRITAYELSSAGIPVTVLCDNMAASLMSQKRIDAVIVGADRIAANGDTANKIGTMGVAILARHFGVPFLVAAPISTIDLKCRAGADIPIEQRDASEVTRPFGHQTAPDGVDVYNPAFDVTPADFIHAIITDRGVARAPYGQCLHQLATVRCT
jgi:methylthioribose-1-phosphate isomerase